MNSNLPGADTLEYEITSISGAGFWLLVNDREYFVTFNDYPAFLQATIFDIFNFEHLGLDQFYWPSLDIDIELEALAHPERFPNIYQP